MGHDEDPATSTAINLAQTLTYGDLHQATVGTNDAGLALDELDVEAPMSLKLKRRTAADFTSLATTPKEEVEDLFVVLSYKLQ